MKCAPSIAITEGASQTAGASPNAPNVVPNVVWSETSKPADTGFVSRGRLVQNETCDVLVVGSGISGAFIAHHLSAAGLDVVVVDQATPASGSTHLSTALVQYEPDRMLVDLIPRLGLADAQAAYRQCYRAMIDLQGLIEAERLHCDLTERATLFLAKKPDDLPHLQHESLAREEIGLAARFVDAQTLQSQHGITRPGALRSPTAYELDPAKLTLALLGQAARSGTRVYDDTRVEVDPFVRDGSLHRTKNGCTVRCKHIVYATGYDTPEQFPELKKLCQLRTTFAVVARPRQTEAATWWRDRSLLWEMGDPYFYARTTPNGRIVIGGEDEPLMSDAARDAAVMVKTVRLLKQLDRATGIREVEVDAAYGATFAATEDGLPYVGSPDGGRSFLALTYGGNGILFGLLAAQILRDQLLGKFHPAAKLFSFQRTSTIVSPIGL